MKALTLHQPWADLIALGMKRCESRSWATNHRGYLVICSAKAQPRYAREFQESRAMQICLAGHTVQDFGKAICLVMLEDCREVRTAADVPEGKLERQVGNYELHCGRYRWDLRLIHRFDPPFPVHGGQRLWNLSTIERDELNRQIGMAIC
jgi:hypothetical protein